MDNEPAAKPSYFFTIPDTAKLIKLRAENDELFDGRRTAAKAAWSLILREMGLEGKVTTEQLSKKWENMKKKYKELKFPPPGMEQEQRITWQWYGMMDKVLGDQYPSSQVSTVDDPFSCLPTKKMCLSQLGNDTLELIPNGLLLDNSEAVAAPAGDDSEIGMDGAIRVMKPLDMNLEAEMDNLRRERLGVEREQAEVDRERLLLVRERDLLEREKVTVKTDKAQLEKDWATVEQDRAAVERDKLSLEKDLAALEKEKLAVTRERERLKTAHGKKVSHSEADSAAHADRQKLRSLFERLLEKF
ncbi:hypothetical protein ACEWY4_010899 [Coilia grayii]|uniref:Myb/SANT-like DNA-binding domain-containing protein n=1 Tax=Coilia grayii TaxID=363190 RepID=A0ABD1K379_9TELE